MTHAKKYHDPKYEAKRNTFIPVAVKHADKAVPNATTDEEKAKWNLAFHQRMNALAGKLVRG